MGLGGHTWVPLALYPLASLISALLYWQDKRQAVHGAWRIPEKVLHASDLLGGWPGALVAQQLFRHKTRKLSYQLVFWAVVLVHQTVWVDYLFLKQRCTAQEINAVYRIAVHPFANHFLLRISDTALQDSSIMPPVVSRSHAPATRPSVSLTLAGNF
ncbi:MAG TPA: hypothetical protein DCE25_00225 [Pseudomonas sp.]|nr:hypothetical protein [Pseudomonas sp.]